MKGHPGPASGLPSAIASTLLQSVPDYTVQSTTYQLYQQAKPLKKKQTPGPNPIATIGATSIRIDVPLKNKSPKT
jgi:hypothetical protein